jgi:hypothetical protein
VPATQQTVGPVAKMMALGEANGAAREAAAAIAVVQRSPQRRRNGPRPGDVSAETCVPSSRTDWPGASGSARTGAST